MEEAIARLGRQDAFDRLEELADLYCEVYAEPPYLSAPKYGRDLFLARTRDQVLSPGFGLVAARSGSRLAGFAFGFTLGAGRWWANASPPPAGLLASEKFAVVELVVASSTRGRGLGRALLDALLTDRAEPWATLATVRDSPAYGMYQRWGWRKVGEFRAEPPYSDAFALQLSLNAGPAGDLR